MKTLLISLLLLAGPDSYFEDEDEPLPVETKRTPTEFVSVAEPAVIPVKPAEPEPAPEPPPKPEPEPPAAPVVEEPTPEPQDKASLIERMILKAKAAQMAREMDVVPPQPSQPLQPIPGMPPAEDGPDDPQSAPREIPKPSYGKPDTPEFRCDGPRKVAMVARHPQQALTFGLTESLDAAVTIDANLPKAMKPLQKQKLIVYCPSDCPACPGIIKRLGDNPLFDLSDVRKGPMSEMPDGIDYFPAIEDPVSGWVFHNASLTDWTTLIKRINMRRDQGKLPMLKKPMAISVGKIKREYVEQALSFLGEAGYMQLGNDPFVYAQGMFSVKLPGQVRIDWTTESDLTKFTFSPKLAVGVSGLRQSVSAITISQDRLTMKIDWLPDVSLDFE